MNVKGIRAKMMLPVYIMSVLFIGFMAIQLYLNNQNLGYVNKMDSQYFAAVMKSDELKLNVVQVQQWLTDISATRAAEGFDDGFEKAEEQADKARAAMEELKTLLPEKGQDIENMKQDFDAYYETGVKMANAYIKDGPEGGNAMMEEFDTVAETINADVDTLKENADGKITDMVSETKKSIQSAIIMVIVSIANSLILEICAAFLIERCLMKPVRRIKKAANELAEGNLDTGVNFTSGDEMGELAKDVNQTIKSLRTYINDIAACMKRMEEGDLTVLPQADFKGSFAALRDSIVNFNTSINNTLMEINYSSEQVAEGSGQVSVGSQSLAQGAAEQAASVEKLSFVVDSISDRIKANAKTADEANRMAAGVGGEARESNEQMKRMMEAMDEISNNSSEIEKIIKTIEDIAFQTNILALNASVEAARAGEAGKGFAVVAGEVRELAEKSAEAVKSTTELIEGSIRAVENGTQIAGAAAGTMNAVVEGIEKVAITIDEISEASGRQAEEIENVTLEVNRISGVVQTVSATAQESGASSEELSGQAQLLRNMIAEFRLRDTAQKRFSHPENAGDRTAILELMDSRY